MSVSVKRLCFGLITTLNISSKPVRGHLTDAKPQIVPGATVAGEVTLHNDEVKRQLQIAHSAYTVDTKDGNNHPARLFVGLDVINPEKKSTDYYWTVLWPDEGVMDAGFSNGPASAEQLLEMARKKMCLAPPKLRELVDLSGPSSIRRTPLIIRDMVLESLPARRVTLLGDAADPMTPCKLSRIDVWNSDANDPGASPWGRLSPCNQGCAQPDSTPRTASALADIFAVLPIDRVVSQGDATKRRGSCQAFEVRLRRQDSLDPLCLGCAHQAYTEDFSRVPCRRIVS